jgi:hypothetical protein
MTAKSNQPIVSYRRTTKAGEVEFKVWPPMILLVGLIALLALAATGHLDTWDVAAVLRTLFD